MIWFVILASFQGLIDGKGDTRSQPACGSAAILAIRFIAEHRHCLPVRFARHNAIGFKVHGMNQGHRTIGRTAALQAAWIGSGAENQKRQDEKKPKIMSRRH